MNYPDSTYLRSLAVLAGRIILKNFKLSMSKKWKRDGSPLTITDIEINDLVLSSFRRDFSHIRIISEEGNQDVDSEDIVYCDPLDGTDPFSRGIPVSTFCISLVRKNIPMVAVIYDPFSKRMWHATCGEGAFLGRTRIHVSQCTELKRSGIFIGWGEKSKFNLPSVCEKLVEAGTRWLNIPSISYLGGLIASGKMEATIHPGTFTWETAPMQLIVEEAGGKATDIFGNSLRYKADAKMSRGHIISNGIIHDQLVKLVIESQSKTPQ
jgi:myo-inositol-1(or 4)-monophosphatase